MPQIDLSALFNLPPEEAIAAFEAKGFKLSWDWHDTWREANAQSFTVAKLVKMDVLQDINDAMKKALAEGQTQRMFDKDLTPILMNKGWWGKKTVTGSDGEPEIVQEGSPRRLQTIFRTNLQTAYAAGRWKEFENNKADRPYLQYVAIMDSRTRPSHAAMSGKVFPIDSPVWDVIAPPNGFNCRCRLRALSAENLKTRGLSVETGGEIIERTDPELIPVKRSGELDPAKLVQRGVSIPDPSKPGQKLTLWADPGWDYNPGKAGAIEANLAKVEKQKLAQMAPELTKAAQAAERLPNYDKAIIDMRKLVEYALNPDHPTGSHKAKRILSSLGLDASDAAQIVEAIRIALGKNPSVEGTPIQWGRVFTVDFPLTGPDGTAIVRTSWIIDNQDDVPRMTSFYVKES